MGLSGNGKASRIWKGEEKIQHIIAAFLLHTHLQISVPVFFVPYSYKRGGYVAYSKSVDR